MIYVGTAAWNIPKDHASLFPAEGSHLERYAQTLNGVEINSSFYRDHKPETYRRWGESVPNEFRFSVKLAKHFTHETRLKEIERLEEVVSGISQLGEKLGVILVQLPPSLVFNKVTFERFLEKFRDLYSGLIAWEPRHKTWATEKAIATLEAYDVSRVIADPEPCPLDSNDLKRLTRDLAYFRFHGSPEIYKSNYGPEHLLSIAESLRVTAKRSKSAWCIFDNTTFGHATVNAVELSELLIQTPNRKTLSLKETQQVRLIQTKRPPFPAAFS